MHERATRHDNQLAYAPDQTVMYKYFLVIDFGLLTILLLVAKYMRMPPDQAAMYQHFLVIGIDLN